MYVIYETHDSCSADCLRMSLGVGRDGSPYRPQREGNAFKCPAGANSRCILKRHKNKEKTKKKEKNNKIEVFKIEVFEQQDTSL